MQLDVFQVISDWHHFAIIQLTHLKDFSATSEWISGALGISRHLASDAWDRLCRLNLVRKSESGEWKPAEEYVSTPDGVPSDAIKNFHEQLLMKAVGGIRELDLEDRDFSTTVFAMDRRRMKEARDRIRAFTDELSRDLLHGSPKSKLSQVMSLSVQLMSLTPALRRKNKK
jgi:uncharacterized protein (TIGR02147 family)